MQDNYQSISHADLIRIINSAEYIDETREDTRSEPIIDYRQEILYQPNEGERFPLSILS